VSVADLAESGGVDEVDVAVDDCRLKEIRLAIGELKEEEDVVGRAFSG
jgi:hypothetical protein